MKYANLHFHSSYSDGILTPTELCALGKKLGFGALALTEHDMYILGGTDHSGRLAAYEERGDLPLEADGIRWDGSLTPYTDDVRTGVTKEEFEALKNRIYG